MNTHKIISKNAVPFWVKLDCSFFRTLEWHHTLEYLATVGFHWLQIFPSAKLKNSYANEEMSPEPTLSQLKSQFWVNCPFKLWCTKLRSMECCWHEVFPFYQTKFEGVLWLKFDGCQIHAFLAEHHTVGLIKDILHLSDIILLRLSSWTFSAHSLQQEGLRCRP